MRHLTRTAVSLFVAALLTFAIGIAATLYRIGGRSFSALDADSTSYGTPEPQAPTRKAAHRVAVVVSPGGVTAYETLTTLAELSKSLSKDWTIDLVSYAAGDSPAHARLSRELALLTHANLGQLSATQIASYTAAVIPPIAASGEPELWKKLEQLMQNTPSVLALGEAVRFLALAQESSKTPARMAGLYSTQKELSKTFPNTIWVSGTRWVESRNTRQYLLTSPGLAATGEAVRVFARRLRGDTAPVSMDREPATVPRLSVGDLLSWIRWIGFAPRALLTEITLAPGVAESAIASILEVFGKSGISELRWKAGSERSVLTAHGFRILVSPTPRSGEPDVQLTPTSMDLGFALRALHAALGRGSESFISRFAERLLVRPPTDLNAERRYESLALMAATWICSFALAWGGWGIVSSQLRSSSNRRRRS